MGFSQKFKYEPKKGIVETLLPHNILGVLYEVRELVSQFDSSMKEANLTQIADLIETGTYGHTSRTGKFEQTVDLSLAKSLLTIYRERSEGGCKSCIYQGSLVIDSSNDIEGKYCKLSDDGKSSSFFILSGRTEKVTKHFDSPCNTWTPQYAPTLDELIKEDKK